MECNKETIFAKKIEKQNDWETIIKKELKEIKIVRSKNKNEHLTKS
jgi:hypothetical protein